MKNKKGLQLDSEMRFKQLSKEADSLKRKKHRESLEKEQREIQAIASNLDSETVKQLQQKLAEVESC